MNEAERLAERSCAERPRALALLGGVAGLLSGLLGIGGGLVVTPALALLGLPLLRASGTGLWVVAPVALAGVAAEGFARPDHLDLALAAAIAAGGIVGVALGRRLARRAPVGVLRALFVFLLLAAAAEQLDLVAFAAEGAARGVAPGHPAWELPVAAGFGVLAGVSAILFGIGGGIVVVPGLLYGVGGVSIAEASAISLLAMVPTALYGAWAAWRDGRTALMLLPCLLPAAMGAAVVGVLLRELWLQPLWLERLFGLFLVFVAVQMLRRRNGRTAS